MNPGEREGGLTLHVWKHAERRQDEVGEQPLLGGGERRRDRRPRWETREAQERAVEQMNVDADGTLRAARLAQSGDGPHEPITRADRERGGQAEDLQRQAKGAGPGGCEAGGERIVEPRVRGVRRGRQRSGPAARAQTPCPRAPET